MMSTLRRRPLRRGRPCPRSRPIPWSRCPDRRRPPRPPSRAPSVPPQTPPECSPSAATAPTTGSPATPDTATPIVDLNRNVRATGTLSPSPKCADAALTQYWSSSIAPSENKSKWIWTLMNITKTQIESVLCFSVACFHRTPRLVYIPVLTYFDSMMV